MTDDASGGTPPRAEPPGRAALDAVADRLRCPPCGAPLRRDGGILACASGHAYDIARQGHVTLPQPRRPASGDDAAMVEAREAFLAAGHYDPIAEQAILAIRTAVPELEASTGCAVELGAGTGHYLARLLEAAPGWSGVALDTSRPALRRAVRAHDRIAAVVSDVWQPLPLQDGAADVLLDVFAPRNAAEISRVLASGGTAVVVTPTGRHLRELVTALGLLRVGEDKRARLQADLAGLEHRGAEVLEFGLRLDAEAIEALVRMGPSAHHVGPRVLSRRIHALSPPVAVTASVAVDAFRRP